MSRSATSVGWVITHTTAAKWAMRPPPSVAGQPAAADADNVVVGEHEKLLVMGLGRET
jgi:hypothetical protein